MVNYDSSPSKAKPAGADVLEALVLVQAIHLLCPLETLLSVTTSVKVVKYVNQGCLHQWQVGSGLLPAVVDHVKTTPRQESRWLLAQGVFKPSCSTPFTLFLFLVSVYWSFQLYFIPKKSMKPPFSAPFLQLIST